MDIVCGEERLCISTQEGGVLEGRFGGRGDEKIEAAAAVPGGREQPSTQLHHQD